MDPRRAVNPGRTQGAEDDAAPAPALLAATTTLATEIASKAPNRRYSIPLATYGNACLSPQVLQVKALERLKPDWIQRFADWLQNEFSPSD